MVLRDAFKEHYLLESTRRNELTSSTAIPIGIFTVVLSALAILIKEIHAPLDEPLLIVQVVFVVLAVLACCFCAFFLTRSLYGLAYGFVPTPLEVSKYRDELATYYASRGMTRAKAELKADGDALDYLHGEYASNADRNARNNDTKSGYIHNAYSALIAAAIFTGVAGLIYSYSSYLAPPQTSKVEVIKMPPLVVPPVSLIAASSPPPPPPPPPRPKPPPSRVVREYRTPPAPPPPPPSR